MIVGALVFGSLGILIGVLLGIIIIHILEETEKSQETQGDFK